MSPLHIQGDDLQIQAVAAFVHPVLYVNTKHGQNRGRPTWRAAPRAIDFDTLGNLLLEPRCGLLVPDFASGGLLHLSGTAEVVLDDTHIGAIDAGLRVNCRVRFRSTRILRRPQASLGDWPLRDRAANKHGPL